MILRRSLCWLYLVCFLCVMVLSACDRKGATKTSEKKETQDTIRIDGSSTVFPITEAVSEEFQKVHPNWRATVGISGTGGGFKKFCRGETDISDASRPIKSPEMEQCKQNGTEFIELPVGYDGLAVVVSKKNGWCSQITVSELRKLWEPDAKGKITRWSDIRADWPRNEIRLYGPGTDSGTFDYFTESICGKERASRSDYTASEDDNVLVQGIANDENALGYFGYAYYENNKAKLKLVAVDDENDANGKGPILPSLETVRSGIYSPLSRPIFIYVSKKSATRPAVKEFARFYLEQAKKLVLEVGYVPLSDSLYASLRQRLENEITDTMFAGGNTNKKTLSELYERKQ